MKRICMVALSILLALTACGPVPGSASQIPAPEESSQEGSAPSATESASPEDRVAAITPSNGERIREKKAENEDVVGWLTAPGTDVDSVIVHAPTKENGFYTNHDFDGNPSNDGTLYRNLSMFHSDKIPEIHPESLIPVGEVVRSCVVRDLQDFDATKLPEGTPLYRLEGYKNMLVAKSGEETFVYGYDME